jgi:hypothetical protein
MRKHRKTKMRMKKNELKDYAKRNKQKVAIRREYKRRKEKKNSNRFIISHVFYQRFLWNGRLIEQFLGSGWTRAPLPLVVSAMVKKLTTNIYFRI